MSAIPTATRMDRGGEPNSTERMVEDTVPTSDESRLQGTIRGETVTVERAAVGLVDAGRAEFHAAGAGLVFANQDVTIDRGGARQIYAGGSVRITQGGAGMILTRGEARIDRGGAGGLMSLGGVNVQQGGAGVVVAGSATIGRGGVVGLAISPRVHVADGGRVLGGPTALMGTILGIALGLLIGRLARRGRP